MNQQGFIIEIVDERTAKLKMQRHSACAACGKCIGSSETKDIVVEVDNTINAKVGDHVEVNMENVNVLKAAAIVYITPLIGLLLGTIGSWYLLTTLGVTSNIEIISATIGILLTVVSFLILKKNDKKYRDSRDYIPVVTRILIK